MRRCALALVWLAWGCDGDSPSPTPSVDSNTNWLEVCGDEGQCPDGTACVCGVCTRTCDEAMCAEFRPGSTCVTGGAGDRLCDEVVAPVAGMCLPACDAATPCPHGQLCLDGACQPNERPPPRCGPRFPCRGDRVCEAGRCVPPPPAAECAGADECAEGEICREGRCALAPECRRDDPDACPEGTECREGRCRALRPCEGDAMCPLDARCDEGQCVTLGDCRSEDSCPPRSTCERGRCVRSQLCRRDDECPAMERCLRGTCRPPPPCPLGQNTFCGYAVGGPEPQGLYSCTMGYFELLEVCEARCLGRPGVGDLCAADCADGPGTYCGDAFGVGASALLRCTAETLVQVAECPAGCVSDGPAAARCAPVE